jgi:hypothetical protein
MKYPKCLSGIKTIVRRDNIDDITYCGFYEEYPISHIVNFDWKTLLENPPKNSDNSTYQEMMYISSRSSNRTYLDKTLVYNIDYNATFLLDELVYKLHLDDHKSGFKLLYNISHPIIKNLKSLFNRARPYQLAEYLNIPIDHIVTGTHHSGSYPSGHVVYSSLYRNILSYHYPEYSSLFDDAVKRTGEARIIQGVHYPSDNLASEKLSKILFSKLYQGVL